MFTYSSADTPLGQSERAYYLSYLLKVNKIILEAITLQLLHFVRCKMLANWTGGDSSEVNEQSERFNLLSQAEKAVKLSTDVISFC